MHTTHSWDFLRMERHGMTPPDSIWNKARYGEDTIIANIDTGKFFSYMTSLCMRKENIYIALVR